MPLEMAPIAPALFGLNSQALTLSPCYGHFIVDANIISLEDIYLGISFKSFS
jgi:hypothetical protein